MKFRVLIAVAMLLFSLSATAQNDTSRSVTYKYCYIPASVSIPSSPACTVTINNFDENSLSKLSFILRFADSTFASSKNIYLTAGNPYPDGQEIRYEWIRQDPKTITLDPGNIEQYLNASPFQVYITIISQNQNQTGEPFKFYRADANNLLEMVALGTICNPAAKTEIKYVDPETRITSKLISSRVYPSDDAIELLEVFNPRLMQNDSVRTDAGVIMPDFPKPTFSQKRELRKDYRLNKKPDAAVSAQFNVSSKKLSELYKQISVKRFQRTTVPVDSLIEKLGEIVFYCNGLQPKSSKIGRMALDFLRRDIDSLNNLITYSLDRSKIDTTLFNNYGEIVIECYPVLRMLASKYRLEYKPMKGTGYVDHPGEDLFASTSNNIGFIMAGDGTWLSAADYEDVDGCYELTFWERIFGAPTVRKMYVYVYLCPDTECSPTTCTTSCFNSELNNYVIEANSLSSIYDVSGRANIAFCTLPDTELTFTVKLNGTTIQEEKISSSSARCYKGKELQIWINLSYE